MLSLRSKLLAGFGAVIAVLVVLALASGSKIDDVGERAVTLGAGTVPATEVVGRIEARVAQLRAAQFTYATAETPAERAEMREELQRLRVEVENAFGDYRRSGLAVEDEPDGHLRAVAAAFRAYERATARIEAGEEGIETLHGAEEELAAIGTRLATWRAYDQRKGETALQAARDAQSSAGRMTWLLLVVGVGLGLTVALLLSRGIARDVTVVLDRLNRLRDEAVAGLRTGLGALAEGDLTRAVSADTPDIKRVGRDELGQVATAVNDIRRHTLETIDAYNETRGALASMIGQVAETAGAVHASSAKVSTTTDEAGRAVTEIAGAIGEVAAGTQRQTVAVDSARGLADEVAAATTGAADQAKRTVESAGEARRIAGAGAEAVDAATAAMAAVRETSDEVTGAIRALGEKSDRIGGIVDAISSIAEQTNLLALNAAIEAARAGDAGRGFAVVADEVRKLAEESNAQARTIGALIGEIQAETQSAVTVVAAGAERTHEGATTVEAAREQFLRIGESVEDVTSRVEEIAGAIGEVAAAAARMNEDMSEVAAVAEQASATTEQVSASSQQTSASTQEIAASAHELAGAADRLQELVGRFRVPAEDGR